MKYARVLLGNSSRKTTELFIDYYTGEYRPRTVVEPTAEPQAQATSTVQNLAAFLPLPYVNVGRGKTQEPGPSEEEEETGPSYQVPKPRTAFSSFVDHPQEFITFLETLINQEDVKEEDKVDLFTTLFEMYLDMANREKDTAAKDEWTNKAKKLIEGKDVRFSPKWLLATHIADTHLYVKRSASFRPVRLPRGINPCTRARRSKIRYLPLIHRRERHPRRDQSAQEIRPQRASTIRRRPDILHVQSADPRRGRR